MFGWTAEENDATLSRLYSPTLAYRKFWLTQMPLKNEDLKKWKGKGWNCKTKKEKKKIKEKRKQGVE